MVIQLMIFIRSSFWTISLSLLFRIRSIKYSFVIMSPRDGRKFHLLQNLWVVFSCRVISYWLIQLILNWVQYALSYQSQLFGSVWYSSLSHCGSSHRQIFRHFLRTSLMIEKQCHLLIECWDPKILGAQIPNYPAYIIRCWKKPKSRHHIKN